MNMLLLIPVFLPIFSGLYMLARPFAARRRRNAFVFAVTVLTSLSIAYLAMAGDNGSVTLLRLDDTLSVALHMDALSRAFAVIIAVMWPAAVLYSFEYMSHEENENRFFAFYIITYGVVSGIASAENYFTLYLFYELLTLATLPLVMHAMNGKARFAGKRYIIYSMSGAAMSFIAMILLSSRGSVEYIYGGGAADGRLAQTVFLFGFFGFGVKSAVVPLHSWLPTAGVAPTPVSALLHAVAVVNSGIFAILRLIYYTVGAERLAGTAAQCIAMGFACVTIVYGSAMALRQRNLKRRLAYSTVSNLSYILLGATLMSPEGLAAALMHMTMHSVIKIILFFCAGALLCATHHRARCVEDYEGFGKKFPLLFTVFAIASLALIGVPPLAGFTSKWLIASAAARLGTPMATAGVACLCVSALLTGLYLMDVLVRAVFPINNAMPDGGGVQKNGWRINLCLAVLTLLLIAVSAFADEIYAYFAGIAGLV